MLDNEEPLKKKKKFYYIDYSNIIRIFAPQNV